ncbi:MAG: integration host factor subunit beta [Lentisphaerae bacterium GWF2_52_8]|nr:MAG: integration host factor subunit beta [Lentisphaerae bacterium GWF2_52_8]
MTKRDIVVKISNELGLKQAEVAVVVQKILDYMSDELSGGGNIEFRDFGVFDIKTMKPRKGRNPNKPQDEVIIPQRNVVRFRAGKELGARVLKVSSTSVK